jgi:hypothetical protein
MGKNPTSSPILRPEAAVAATKARTFRETLGTPLHNVERVWFLLDQEELQPPNGCPKHLFWVLHFLNVYPLQALGCAAVDASGRAEDPPEVGLLGLHRGHRQAR